MATSDFSSQTRDEQRSPAEEKTKNNQRFGRDPDKASAEARKQGCNEVRQNDNDNDTQRSSTSVDGGMALQA